MLTTTELEKLKTSEDLLNYLQTHKNDNPLFQKVYKEYLYEEELKRLQSELVNLQKWVIENKKKIAIIFEGRDASGKGGTIRRFAEHLNPRAMRVVALNKPTEIERHQWYFNRYIKELPNAGEIVFFDRSWYNRAVVEPVNGFCTEEEYNIFMEQVNDVEKMIIQSGIQLVKLYFSISKKEQEFRFKEIQESSLKKWKYSPVDQKALALWDKYTEFKEKMFEKTSTNYAPWRIIKANRKTKARIDALEYILQEIPYIIKDNEVIVHQEIE